MKDSLLFLLFGGLIGYGGSILNYIFAVRKHKKHEIWKEKIRIYSKVIEELGKSFLELEKFPNTDSWAVERTKFALRLGSILAPARLVASTKLEEELRDLFEKEIAWYDTLENKSLSKENSNEISDRASLVRYKTEQLMRKELRHI